VLLGQSKFEEARKVLEKAKAFSPESDFLKTKLVEAYVTEGDHFRTRNAQRARAAYEEALAIDPANAAARRGLTGMDEGRRASQQRQKRVEELTEQGLAQLRNEQFRQAYASFSEVLKLDSTNARAKEFRDQAAELLESQIRPMYDEGVRLYNAGELAASMAQFQKVLQQNPDHAETRSFLAKALEKVRAEAVDLYKRAYIYEGLGRLEDALELYRQCLALLPDPREEYNQKANQRIQELNRRIP
ncbi:MAG: tetratricopeptide repeat protein, partial [Vicinamibacteria bacterium]